MASTLSPEPRSQANRLVRGSIIVTGTAMLLLLVLAGLFTREMISLESRQQSDLVKNALIARMDSHARQIDTLLVWDDAVREVALNRNQRWMRATLGEYLSNISNIEQTYVLGSDFQPIFDFHRAGKPKRDYAQVAPALGKMFGDMRIAKPVQNAFHVQRDLPQRLNDGSSVQYRRISHLIAVDGRVYMATLARFTPGAGADLRLAPPHYLLTLTPVSDVFLRHFSEGLGIADLHWAKASPAPLAPRLQLTDDRNQAIGTLTWTLQSSAMSFALRVAPLALLGILILGGLAVHIARKTKLFETELLAAEARALKLAESDALTGLPNRRAINSAAASAFDPPPREDAMVGMFAINLDNFKELNEFHGHGGGDSALRQLGQTLLSRKPENVFIARVGADDFMAICRAKSEAELMKSALSVMDLINTPVTLPNGAPHRLAASIGVAAAPAEGRSVIELMRAIDAALGRAKREGGNRVVRYDHTIDDDIRRRRELERSLREAVAGNHLNVVYQPVLDSQTLAMRGVEALVRWTHPERGAISPADFIPLAERTGLIHELGRQVLEKACRDALAWPSVRVAVNVSPDQLRRADLTSIVMDVLDETGFPADRLELEITESALIGDERSAHSQLRALQALGVRIALDDFGTGYSSLGYLRRLNFNKVKIDRSFVQDVEASSHAATIVRSVVGMCRALGLEVTAEGIETVDQQHFVEEAGVTHLQGFLLGRPCSADAISERLRTQASVAA
jgi:diguanylate cyclase (GGDEF)-like protein